MTGWKLKLTIAAVLLCAPLSARAEDKVCSTMIKGAAEIGYTLAADEYAVVSYLLFQSVQTTTVTYGPGQRVAKTFSNPNMAANPWVYSRE